MPHGAGMRDLQVFLRPPRAAARWTPCPIVATMDLPLVDRSRVRRRWAGTSRSTAPIGARTAALTAPYDDGAGDGTLYYEDDELAEFFHAGHAAGLQVGVHAIGDRAIEQVLRDLGAGLQDARLARAAPLPRPPPPRSSTSRWPSPAHVERAAMLGLAVSVQPTFDALWGQPDGLYEQASAPSARLTMNPFRTMLERGVEVGVGSDSPVTPLDPLLTVAALEHHHDPSQRLAGFEAIRLHTIGSARLAHQEEKKGTLGPGMHADFVAFDGDPFEAAASWRSCGPVLTVSLGREVFAAGLEPAALVTLSAGAELDRPRRTDVRFAGVTAPAEAHEDPRSRVENAAPRRRGPKGLLGPHLFSTPARPPSAREWNRRRAFVGAAWLHLHPAAVQSARNRGAAPRRWST